ncbi:MAG: class I SAM-dependent methyltransferase [Frankia sp.]|nr:class I SAM-dependent methyltransferase [Frankia sp.]
MSTETEPATTTASTQPPGAPAAANPAAGAAGQFHFDPDSYLELVLAEVPGYARLQDEVGAAAATTRGPVTRVLDLGAGTGETSRRVLAAHPGASLVALDESEPMLAAARRALPADAELVVGRLEDPLPAGPFDLVVSALAVHHLHAAGKADLFRRVADVLRPGGRFVLADVVVPEEPVDVVTRVCADHDRPSSLLDQLSWLVDVGFAATVRWRERDLAVVTADRH